MRYRFLLLSGDDSVQAQAIMRLVERDDRVVAFVLRDRMVAEPEDFPTDDGEEPAVTPEMLQRVRAMEGVDIALEESVRPMATAIGAVLEIVDLWKQDDYSAILRDVLGRIRQRGDAPGRMYVTECPLHVAAAVLTACFLQGVPVTIPDSERARGGTADLPILRMSYAVVLTPQERKTLDSIIKLQARANRGPNFKAVASELGIKVSTLSKRVKGMAKAGIVHVHDHPDNAREGVLEATPAGRLFAEAVKA
jgi:DNA-binding MarR family transcriptional regulator